MSQGLAQETKTGETKATHNLPGLANAVYLICLNDWRTESFSFPFIALCYSSALAVHGCLHDFGKEAILGWPSVGLEGGLESPGTGESRNHGHESITPPQESKDSFQSYYV